jgi:hypothetical protein
VTHFRNALRDEVHLYHYWRWKVEYGKMGKPKLSKILEQHQQFHQGFKNYQKSDKKDNESVIQYVNRFAEILLEL